MLVHADQAGDHGVALQIEAPGGGRNRSRRGDADSGDFSVIDEDGLILGGGRASAVDHADVQQSDDGALTLTKGWMPGVNRFCAWSA